MNAKTPTRRSCQWLWATPPKDLSPSGRYRLWRARAAQVSAPVVAACTTPPRYYPQRRTEPVVVSALPLLPAGKWVSDGSRRQRIAVCRMIPPDAPLWRTLRHLAESRLDLPAKLRPALTAAGRRLLLRMISTC